MWSMFFLLLNLCESHTKQWTYTILGHLSHWLFLFNVFIQQLSVSNLKLGKPLLTYSIHLKYFLHNWDFIIIIIITSSFVVFLGFLK